MQSVAKPAALPPDDGWWTSDSVPGGLTRWLGWRMRALGLLALLGCVCLFVLTRELANVPRLHATWRGSPQGQLQLATSPDPQLRPLIGKTLLGAVSGNDQVPAADALALQRSERWLVDDADRARHRALQRQLQEAVAQDSVRLYFDGGGQADVPVVAHGSLRLGLVYWLLSGLALVLYLVAMAVFLARPALHNGLYSLMALCQSGNLLFLAAGTALDLVLPPFYTRWELPARTAFDLVTAAAILHAACLRPRRMPRAGWIAGAGWAVAALVPGLQAAGWLANGWWWTQAGGALMGLAVIAVLSWSYRIEPHPYAMVLRRFAVVAAGTWMLLTAAAAAVHGQPDIEQNIAQVGSMVWVVFLASLLLLMPFIARSQQLLREFSLLAGISTVATSLDLLFVALFSFGQFTSLTLSLFFAFGLYAAARQWIINHLRGTGMVTMERLFERLYRMAREVEAQPERASAALLSLLREVFEPLSASVAPRALDHATATGDGSTLLVPMPDLTGNGLAGEQTLTLRFAQRGRRLFTTEDARLADRIADQLKRAIAFDKAVERGRSEERSRIAQDLHDDIGARLLTLMYQASSRQQEDYLRHTLQDLKTLTRGLAANGHRLSHAAGEWKADVQQRLALAHITLDWRADFAEDPELSMLQWSTLTRVLRELVSNAIAHAGASRLTVVLSLADDAFTLSVEDDGHGRDPHSWSAGLGLGGVRKRVRQLGGEVRWREADGRGIACDVRFAHWSQAALV